MVRILVTMVFWLAGGLLLVTGCETLAEGISQECSTASKCTCEGAASCSWTCPGGACFFECNGSGSCAFSCSGGGCTVKSKGSGATSVDCPGNGCNLTCTGSGSCGLTSCSHNCDVSCAGSSGCNNSCHDEQTCSRT